MVHAHSKEVGSRTDTTGTRPHINPVITRSPHTVVSSIVTCRWRRRKRRGGGGEIRRREEEEERRRWVGK